MPNWLKVLRLLFLHNKQNLIRIRYDWGRELVVISSTAIMLGLFYYIFYDFLHIKLNDLPLALRSLISDRLVGILLLTLGLIVAGRLRALVQTQPSWGHFAEHLGEDPKVVVCYRWLQAFLIITLNYGIFWWWIAPAFVQWDFERVVLLQSISLGIGGLSLSFNWSKSQHKIGAKLRPMLSDAKDSRRHTLRAWRWFQIIQRNRLCRLCGMLCLALELGIGLIQFHQWPFFLSILASMLASALLAWTLAFQLEEDMRALWLEKQLGCSHEEFVAVYQELGFALGLLLGLISLSIMLLTGVPGQVALGEWWKLIAISALFPIIMPSIMFQVAPDKPLLQILISSLMGLFLGTAIYAQGWSIIVVAIAIHYAKTYQNNNFYRA